MCECICDPIMLKEIIVGTCMAVLILVLLWKLAGRTGSSNL